MSEILFKIIRELAGLAEIYIMTKLFLHWEKHERKEKIMFLCSSVVIIFWIVFLDPPFFIDQPMIIVSWMILAKGSFLERMIDISVSYAAVYLLNALTLLAGIVFAGIEYNDPKSEFICVCISLIIMYVLLKVPAIKRGTQIYSRISKVKKILLLFFMLLTIVLAAFAAISPLVFTAKPGMVLFSVTVLADIIGIVVCLFMLLMEAQRANSNHERAAMQEQIISAQKQYYETLLEKEKELRRFRHDIGSQLGVLRYYFDKDDKEELEKQLGRITETYERAATQTIHIGNDLIDTIINVEYSKYADQEIHLKVEGSLTENLKCDSYDLCTIISNSLRNALESCVEINGNRTIVMNLYEHNGTFRYMIDNPANRERYNRIGQKTTSKVNDQIHGHGVNNIRDAVKRLDGMMNYQYEDGRVKLEVII